MAASSELNDFEYSIKGDVETVYGVEKPWQAAYIAAVENIEPSHDILNASNVENGNHTQVAVYDQEDTVIFLMSQYGKDTLNHEDLIQRSNEKTKQ